MSEDLKLGFPRTHVKSLGHVSVTLILGMLRRKDSRGSLAVSLAETGEL